MLRLILDNNGGQEKEMKPTKRKKLRNGHALIETERPGFSLSLANDEKGD